MTKNLLITVVAIIVLTLGSVYWYQHTQLNSTQSVATSTPTSTPMGTTSKPVVAPVAATTTSTVDHPGMKLYRNDQWGFEFQYPSSWGLSENSFGGDHTAFNIIASPNGEILHPPFIVNIVTPTYADHAFLNRNARTSDVTVAGMAGTKYEYEYEGATETAIVLPFGQYKVILGTRSPYENVFNQIVASFKFLK